MKLQSIFPVTIGIAENPDHLLIEKTLIKECFTIKNTIPAGGDRWEGNVYNTNNTYNLTKNKQFNSLHEWIFKNVNDYAYNIGYKNKKIQCLNSWFNIYDKYNYQEKHEHYPSDISAVYYLFSPQNSGNIKFYSHEPNSTKDCYEENNPLTWSTYEMQPRNGLLLIFKSNLIHGVQQNKSNKQKISLALNFKVL